MKIKDMETASGIDRATIRYYEKEGLLDPQRTENGYREYSEEDLLQLHKIRLLRSLHISLEDIRLLTEGKRNLRDIISRQAGVLEDEAEDVRFAGELCRTIYKNEISYSRLDPLRYLKDIHEDAEEKGRSYFTVEDELPMVYDPWRRFFARGLDQALAHTLWMVFLALALNMRIGLRTGWWTLLDNAVAVLIMLLLEPFFLSKLGTTPGKFVLGLSIRSSEGEKLTLQEAFDRTLEMAVKGMGLMIPGISLFTHAISYQRLKDGSILSWDRNLSYRIKDRKPYRMVPFVLIHLALVGIILVLTYSAYAPPHKGEITVAEFTENFNHFLEIYDMDFGNYSLEPKGTWKQKEYDVLEHYTPSHLKPPQFWFSLSDGVVKGVSFGENVQDADYIPSYGDYMMLAALSLAEHDSSLFNAESRAQRLIRAFYNQSFRNFEITDMGLVLTNTVETRNFRDDGSYLFREEREKEVFFMQAFSIMKAKASAEE